MPDKATTASVRLAFDQHCTDNKLTKHQAYLLSQKEPQQIAVEIPSLRSFDNRALKNSIRAIRKEKTNEAKMQWAHPSKKPRTP